MLCLYRSARRALIFVDIHSIVNARSLSITGVAGAELFALSGKSRLFQGDWPILSSLGPALHRSQISSSGGVIWRGVGIPDETGPSRMSSSRVTPQLEQEAAPPRRLP